MANIGYKLNGKPLVPHSGHIDKDARFAAAHFRQTDPLALHPEDPDNLYSYWHLWLLGKKMVKLSFMNSAQQKCRWHPALCGLNCDERPFVIV